MSMHLHKQRMLRWHESDFVLFSNSVLKASYFPVSNQSYNNNNDNTNNNNNNSNNNNNNNNNNKITLFIDSKKTNRLFTDSRI